MIAVGVPCVIGWGGRLLDERDVTSEFGNAIHRAIAGEFILYRYVPFLQILLTI